MALAEDLQQLFDDTFKLTKFIVYDHVYKGEHANTYLASFTRFLGENKSHPQVREIVLAEFNSYFQAFFSHLKDTIEYPFHFTGGVAFHFNEFVRETGEALGLHVGRIVQSPIAGLALYHQENG